MKNVLNRDKDAKTPVRTRNPYERFGEASLILRDHLAIDRTILANERTLLAYCRTALALALTGAGVIKFFDARFVADIVGWGLILMGIVAAVVGGWRSVRMARNINTMRARDRDIEVTASDSE